MFKINLTFADFVKIWRKDYGSKELSPTMYSRYLGILNTRILTYFGKFRLDKIRPTDIMKFYNLFENDTQIKRLKNNRGQILTKPLSKKTILEHYRLLRAILHKAAYWQLFVQNDGKPMHPSTISKRFVKFVKEFGLLEISFHGLRDTNATLLTSQNINAAIVIVRLEHAQISTIFNFYVHSVISHNKVAGNVLENLLIPGKNKANSN